MKKTAKNSLKFRLLLAIFSLFFACFSLNLLPNSTSVYADPPKTSEEKIDETSEEAEETDEESEAKTEEKQKKSDEKVENVCKEQSAALGWLICPASGALSKAIDSIYGTIENFLIINPIASDDTSTIHIIWEYVKGVTNIVFIIFLLVVVYSHLTGLGISNYNLKRILPRLIVVAILVNLSFFICQLAVDISNLLGYSLHDLFISVEKEAIARGTIKQLDVSWTDLINVLTGAGTAVGITIALTGGLGTLFWTLVPVLIGAIVSIAIGFITISMRQAVVAVLVMIAPLAFVCFLLPNTEKWFKKWKDTLSSMLVFYPAFSFLFGASHLAGWAIITSSVNESGETSGFGVLLGLAVQVFPLFFSWKLMQMSGTVLGAVSQKLHGLSARPLAAVGRASMLNRDLARSKYLGTRAKGIGQEAMQRVHDRQIRKMSDSMRYKAQAKLRSDANAARIRKHNGEFTRRAETFYEMQADSMQYQRQIARTKNDFNKGLGYIAQQENLRNATKTGAKLNSAKYNRLQNLDNRNILSSDTLRFELARGEKVDYDNAVGFHNRVEQALDAHIDDVEKNNLKHQRHTALGEGYGSLREAGLSRYETIKQIMEGEVLGTYYVKADAASSYATQAKIVSGKFQTAYDLTPATQDVENQVRELASRADSTSNIDQIVAGLRTISTRGDTDIIKRLLDETLSNKKVQLGTHASQSLANFLMFDVKDSDPLLRRYGKYINLETAHVFNDQGNPDKIRWQRTINFDEYILGEYENPEQDLDGNPLPPTGKPKRNAVKLLEGTSLDNVERTFYRNLDESVRKAYANSNGSLSDEAKKEFVKKRKAIYNAMAPAFISASLKYPSGSEQLVSAVSYLTGIEDDNGILVKRWEKQGDALYGLDEDYFRKCAKDYLKDQIPSQILNMRTDYRASLTEHLLNALFEEGDGVTNGATLKAEYESELARINSMPESTNDEIEKKKKALTDLKISTAGKKAREIWEQNGTLTQLYKSRRSGAANNAKQFVRTWANLDNESEIIAYLKERAKEERRKRREAGEPDVDAGGDPISIYSDQDRIAYQAQIDDMLSRIGNNPENFYKKTRRYILNKLDLVYIAEEYENYHKNNKHANAQELAVYLKELLADEENYPTY